MVYSEAVFCSYRLNNKIVQTQLQAVLRLRESRSRNLSKHSEDFTDDEDLGLPKSLQNSPGDFSDGLEVAPRGPAWMR